LPAAASSSVWRSMRASRDSMRSAEEVNRSFELS
jgi:hypothetical protein